MTTKTSKMTNKQDVFENKNERNDFIIALIVIAVFTVFVFMLLKKGTPEDVLPKKEVLFEDSINTDTINVVNNNSLKDNKIKKAESTENKVLLNANSKNDTISALIISNKLATPSLIKESQNSTINLTPRKTVETLEIEETIDKAASLDNTVDIIETNNIETGAEIEEEINNDTINTENQPEEIVTETAVEIIPNVTTKVATEVAEVKQTNSLEDCVIVVGVYEDEDNLNKTLKKLEENGFTSTSGKLNNSGFYYAGEPVQCNKNKLKTKMNRLNAVFGVESWLHKK